MPILSKRSRCGKRQVLVAAALDAEADQVVGQDGVGVAVAADGVRRPLLRPGRRPLEGVRRAGVDVEMIRVAERGIEVRVADTAEPDAARHAQDVRDADLLARIPGRLPLRHRRGLVELVDALLNQHAHQGRGQALPHRPALERRVHRDARAVALADEASLVGHDERGGQPLGRLEGGVDRLLHLVGVDLGRQRRVGQHVSHRPRRGRRIRQGAPDVNRLEEDVVLADRQGDAAVVAVQLRGADDAVRQGQVDAPLVVVDLAVGDVAPVLVGPAEEPDALGREVRVEAGDEDGRAERLGEARDVVRQRIAWRGDVLGVELRLRGARQHRRALVLLLAAGRRRRGGQGAPGHEESDQHDGRTEQPRLDSLHRRSILGIHPGLLLLWQPARDLRHGLLA